MNQIITIPNNTRMKHVVTSRLVNFFLEAELTAVQQYTFLVDCLEGVSSALEQAVEEGNIIELHEGYTVFNKKELEEIKEDFTTLVKYSLDTIKTKNKR